MIEGLPKGQETGTADFLLEINGIVEGEIETPETAKADLETEEKGDTNKIKVGEIEVILPEDIQMNGKTDMTQVVPGEEVKEITNMEEGVIQGEEIIEELMKEGKAGTPGDMKINALMEGDLKEIHEAV